MDEDSSRETCGCPEKARQVASGGGKADRLLLGVERRTLCSKLWTTSKVFISQENDFENRRSRKRVCEIKE
jgi:hypothetical protein